MAKQEQRGFRYEKRSKDTLKERANMKGGNFDTYIKPKFKQWKPKEGKNRIRILPPTWTGAKHYGLDIYVNFNIGADNQSYLSLSKHERGADPLVEARREAQHEGDKQLTKALQPSQRILYWIIDRNDEDEGPLLWAAPFTFDKSLSNLCIDEDTKEVIFIDDPIKGRDVRFYREGTGLKTSYDPSKMKILPESTVHEDEGQEQDWLDFVADNPLPDCLQFYEYNHIKAVFDGQAGRTEDDDDDKPARKRASRDDTEEKPVRSRSRIAADEDEDAEEKPSRNRQRTKPSDDEDVDVEDEKSQRRPTSRRPADDADDEAAKEDDKPQRRQRAVVNEDEDDEKPARGKTSRRRPADEDEGEQEELPSRGRGKNDDEEGGGTLRERLARRRSRSSDDD